MWPVLRISCWYRKCTAGFILSSSIASNVWPQAEQSRTKPKRRTSVWLMTALVVWLGAVAGGTIALVRYSEAPGAVRSAPENWPGTSSISRDTRTPTLIMFLHPRCPCSRASVGELERLLTKVHGKLDVCVAFVIPAGADAEWTETDLMRRVQSLPAVRSFKDDRGTQARLFGAETSGQTVFYDAAGKLRFSGGITAGRAHAGDNPGSSALEELVLHGKATTASTPVFGCALFDTKCPETLCKPQ